MSDHIVELKRRDGKPLGSPIDDAAVEQVAQDVLNKIVTGAKLRPVPVPAILRGIASDQLPREGWPFLSPEQRHDTLLRIADVIQRLLDHAAKRDKCTCEDDEAALLPEWDEILSALGYNR